MKYSKIKKIAIYSICFIQVCLIFFLLNKEIKYFNWSMYHIHATYKLDVSVNDTILDAGSIYRRYKLYKNGEEYRSIGHIKRKIINREEIYGKDDVTKVVLIFNENKSGVKKWEWQNK
ncbi:hypothetical protein [Flavicella sediminum]|uniref:hypothetical protein n=1 Tax=Flavicella sediminum TaxID=2585141 RepID=UPI00112435C4|nr:hypothetical protein [Flavicella sediminum]